MYIDMYIDIHDTFLKKSKNQSLSFGIDCWLEVDRVLRKDGSSGFTVD